MIRYYTGRAGDGYLSEPGILSEAFFYDTREAAQYRAECLMGHFVALEVWGA